MGCSLYYSPSFLFTVVLIVTIAKIVLKAIDFLENACYILSSSKDERQN